MQKFLTPIDFSKLEAISFRLQNLSTAPSSPVEGQLYYDTDDDTIYLYTGAGWVALATGTSGFTQEQITDFVGAMFSGNTETGITATFQDGDDTIDLVLDDEYITDLVGAMFTGNTETGVTVTYQGADNTIDVVVGSLDGLPAPLADLSMATFKITNLGTPTASTDAATKGYVDGVAQGLSPKTSVRVATAAAGTLASSFENGDTVDGVALATGDRILIKDQAAGAENGIYVVAASGAPARASDFDTAAEVQAGAFVFVEEGTANADSGWVLTTDGAITLGTTALAFTQFSGAGQITAGSALTKSGNTLDVAVDGATIEVSGDAIRVKDAGITDAKLASTFTKKFSATVGDNSSTSIAVTHSLGTRDVQVEVYDASTFETVLCDLVRTSTSVVTLGFAVAPATNALRVVVTG
jgi:hypothetical protein